MQTKASLVALALALSACGSSPASDPKGPTPVIVPVSGHVAVMPIPPAAADEDFSDLNVHMFNPASLMVNPKRVAPVATSPLDTADAQCTMQGCPFLIDEVNVASLPMGLVGQLSDAGKSLRWAPVYTGIVSPDATRSASATHSALENNVIWAMPMASLQTVANSMGLAVDDLNARGLLIGLTTAPLGETSAITHVPPSVPGVKVTVVGRNSDSVNILYPNDDYTGTNTDAGTNRDGVFYAVGVPGGNSSPFTTSLDLTDPTGARQWKTQMAGIGPTFTLITGYPAN